MRACTGTHLTTADQRWILPHSASVMATRKMGAVCRLTLVIKVELRLCDYNIKCKKKSAIKRKDDEL